jgi:hypothetical protein
MAPLRRRLRLCAATWLVFQVACLSALAPRDCCAAHRPAKKSCHESASAMQCPMRAADGRPCPMHRSQAGRGVQRHGAAPEHHHPPAPSPAPDCRVSGVCAGPMAALSALLSHNGILPESPAALHQPIVRPVRMTIYETAIRRFEPPEPPPPRA